MCECGKGRGWGGEERNTGIHVEMKVVTMGHEEGADALLQHVLHLPLQPAPRPQPLQDVPLCQQVHLLRPSMTVSDPGGFLGT